MSKPDLIPVIALVGGIGSGKSFLVRSLAETEPIAIIDADRIGHEVLTDKEVMAQVRQEFGAGVFDDQGAIIRRALGQMVFGKDAEHQAARVRLERIVHPRIRDRIRQQIAEIRSSRTYEAIFLDAAILLESGWKDECQGIVYVDVPAEERLRRVVSERNWTPEEFFAREANQLPVELKQQAADFTVINFPAGPAAVNQLRLIYRRIKDGFSR
ncbi:MAG: dephospho-CoA kinase [Planctomycetaceae bacterium]|nr:dephospho-CoA kinase [Planctomycetaceae bacterium]